MIYDYLIILLLFVISFIVFIYSANQLNLNDQPELNLNDQPENRKIHTTPVPYIGGTIIFFIINILSFYREYPFEFNFLIYTSSIVFIIGFLDDKLNLNPLIRLFFQFCSSVIILGSGIIILNLGYYYFIGNLELYYFSYIITIFCIIISINSFNFIDGIDGLCSGVFISSILLIIIYSLYFNSLFNHVFLSDILFVVICFFISNFFLKKYKIFLGDSGSNLLGFYVSVALIFYTQSDHSTFHPVLAIWVIAIPVFDFFSILIIRVFYLKMNPMKSDKKHIHHILISKNLSTKNITLLLITINLFLGLFGLAIYEYFGSLICLLIYLVTFYIYLYLTRFVISNFIN